MAIVIHITVDITIGTIRQQVLHRNQHFAFNLMNMMGILKMTILFLRSMQPTQSWINDLSTTNSSSNLILRLMELFEYLFQIQLIIHHHDQQVIWQTKIYT